jgi:hypothetical protein
MELVPSTLSPNMVCKNSYAEPPCILISLVLMVLILTEYDLLVLDLLNISLSEKKFFELLSSVNDLLSIALVSVLLTYLSIMITKRRKRTIKAMSPLKMLLLEDLRSSLRSTAMY